MRDNPNVWTPKAPEASLAPDLCVVGAGRAGLAVARGAAAFGMATVVVERAPLANPLPRAGETAGAALRHMARLGLEGRNFGVTVDWDRVRAAATAAAEREAPAMNAAHLRAIGAEVVEAEARFADGRTILAGGHRILPRRIVLATGAVRVVPRLPGLDEVPWTDADRWLDLESLPRSAVVLGAGRDGAEIAQALHRLGCRTTVVDEAVALPEFDPELAAPVLARLHREGLVILPGRDGLRVEGRRDGIALVFRDRDGREAAIEAAHLVLATGRRAAVDGLGLDRAGITCDPDGIVTGPGGRTANPKIHAAGDVAGRGGSTASAEAQAAIVLRDVLFRQRLAFDPRAVPRLLHTDPAVAVVGLTEAEARRRHGRIGVWRWPHAETAIGRAAGTPAGHIKVLTTVSGRLLGAGIVGPEAAETIGLWTLAIARNLDLGDIAALPLPAESFADVSRRVALQGAFAGSKGVWLRRAARLIRVLG